MNRLISSSSLIGLDLRTLILAGGDTGLYYSGGPAVSTPIWVIAPSAHRMEATSQKYPVAGNLLLGYSNLNKPWMKIRIVTKDSPHPLSLK